MIENSAAETNVTTVGASFKPDESTNVPVNQTVKAHKGKSVRMSRNPAHAVTASPQTFGSGNLINRGCLKIVQMSSNNQQALLTQLLQKQKRHDKLCSHMMNTSQTLPSARV